MWRSIVDIFCQWNMSVVLLYASGIYTWYIYIYWNNILSHVNHNVKYIFCNSVRRQNKYFQWIQLYFTRIKIINIWIILCVHCHALDTILLKCIQNRLFHWLLYVTLCMQDAEYHKISWLQTPTRFMCKFI